jgi:hypothetical protein
MSSTYVPPHKRNENNKTERKAVTFDTEKDFVPLVSNDTKPSNTVDWKAIKFENSLSLPPPPQNSNIPIHTRKLMPIRDDFYASESEHESDVEEVRHTEPLNDQGWTLVEKKVKPKRDKIQEALDNGDAPLSDEEEEQSYWDDQPEEYETYWDRKP